MAKHTPGPYRAEESGDGKQTAFYGADPSELCEPVFVVEHDDVTEEGQEEVEANIALLTSAPNLLTALRELVKLHDDCVFACGDDDEAIVDAALAVARDALKAAS